VHQGEDARDTTVVVLRGNEIRGSGATKSKRSIRLQASNISSPSVCFQDMVIQNIGIMNYSKDYCLPKHDDMISMFGGIDNCTN